MLYVAVNEGQHYRVITERITQFSWGVLDDEIKIWLYENITEDYILKIFKKPRDSRLYFVSEEDAFKFKMRWS